MARLTRLGIRGFRRLHDVEIEMRPLTVMIGANGVGKSSVLDVFSLLSSCASGKLDSTFSDLGGIHSVLTRGHDDELKIEVSVEDPPRSGSFEYSISLARDLIGFQIVREQLTQNAAFGMALSLFAIEFGQIKDRVDKSLGLPSFILNERQTALYQAPSHIPDLEGFRRNLSSQSLYHVLDVSERAPIKSPQQLRPSDSPGANGEGLAPFLYTLQQNNKRHYEAIIHALRAAFPTFEGFGFPPIAAGTIAITWEDRQFGKLYMNELSEGALRFIWLAALLQSPSLPTITMIDEPEVSLHPELLALLADLMREASARTQLVVATHSDRFVSFLRPEELLVLDSDEAGFTTATWAEQMDVQKWLDDYTLGEVWRMGQIGARA